MILVVKFKSFLHSSVIMPIIMEQGVKIEADLPQGDPTKKQKIFYNPVMRSNRNISILLLNAVENKDMAIADPLAGSGIRSLRFLKELDEGKIGKLFVNDKKEHFRKMLVGNLSLNGMKDDRITISNDHAEHFLLNSQLADFSGYFDYIDIDPFGTPNPFLSSAVNKIKRHGILAVTATDTAALTGTYPQATKRKYWARNVRNYLMHETGLRILIRKIQLQGVQFDKALIPLLAYHKDHYFRIYFRSGKGKERCDAILKEHQYLLLNPATLEFRTSPYAEKAEKNHDIIGPLWTGKLFDQDLLKKMVKHNHFEEEKKFLSLLLEESQQDRVGFYDLHALAKKYKKEPPRMDAALERLKGVRTHLSGNGIRTAKKLTDVVKVLK